VFANIYAEESATEASIHHVNPLDLARYSRQNLKLIHFKQMRQP